MRISAPADKRFRRAHVSPRKRSWLPAFSWLAAARLSIVAGIILYGGYSVVELALSAEALTISRISVSGNTRMSRGEVLSLLEGLNGQNMVAVDLEEWRQKLLTSPWVADAAIRRVLPGTVAVMVSERQPMAVGRLGDQLYLLDQRGNVIDEYGPNYAELDLPIVDGLASSGGTASLLIDEARAALVMRLIAALQTRPDLAKRVSQIDVADVHDAVLILKDDTALVRIGEDRFTERLQSYLDLVTVLRARIPDIDYVDLRFDERVYVRPRTAVAKASLAQRPRVSGKGD
jgi:cell division protein FtsQ